MCSCLGGHDVAKGDLHRIAERLDDLETPHARAHEGGRLAVHLDRVRDRVHAQPDRCIPVPPAPSTLVRAHMPSGDEQGCEREWVQ